MKEGPKLYNWLHLTAGHAMIFANISWASTRQNLSSGLPTKRDSNPSLLIYKDCLEDQNYA